VLSELTTGSNNTALGYNAGDALTTTSDNIMIGNIGVSGDENICFGTSAGGAINSGTRNLCMGTRPMISGDVTGDDNIGIGFETLDDLTIGSDNVCIGNTAGNGITVGSNVIIGNAAGSAITTASNTIAIDSPGMNAFGTIDIGTFGTHASCFIQGIDGVTVAGATAVVVGASGELGTVISSRKYKENISELDEDEAMELLNLNPVKFNYKTLPNEQSYGLIAEEVNEAMPDFVLHRNENIQSVKYETLHAHYIKMMQMVWKKIENLEESTIKREGFLSLLYGH